MKRLFFWVALFLCTAETEVFAEGQPQSQPRFSFPKAIRAGDVAEVVIWSPQALAPLEVALENAQGKVLDRTQAFKVPDQDLPPGFSSVHVEAVLLATEALSPDQTLDFVVFNAQKAEVERSPVQILHRSFPTEVVHLNPVMTKLREYPHPVVKHQAESIWKIYLTTDVDVFQTGLYALPFSFSPRRSALFGDTRTYISSNGKSSTTFHRGYDFAVPRGTPVLASGSGRVVLAEFRDMTGGTVVLEHLPGLYGDYFHMDRLDVHVGQRVRQGEVLGLSGATGLVTGPHLHWEFRLHGYSVDGEQLLSQGILDKKRLAELLSTAER
jgi:murein DD-endopeptidase MepM/ murein hydrolase activator NlpD